MGWLLVVLIVMVLSPWIGFFRLLATIGRHNDDIGELQRWVLSHHNLLPSHQWLKDSHDEMEAHA